VTGNQEIATTRRCVRAGRIDGEMGGSAPLEIGEYVVAEGVVRSTSSSLLQRLSYLRVSTARICLVRHFAFRPDELVNVPRAALTSVSCDNPPWVDLNIAHESGDIVVSVKPWERRSRRLVVEPVLNLSAHDLCGLLRDGRLPD
jgi:hypothetical protein